MSMTRASAAQMQTMLDFLEKHRILVHGRPTTPEGRIKAKALWRQLTAKLNSMGGAVKDVSSWKKSWNDKRTTLKKIAAKHMRSARLKSGVINLSQLSPVDRKILALLGRDTSTRMVEVSVSAYPQTDKIMDPVSEPEIKEPLSPTSTYSDIPENHSPQHNSGALSENSEAAEPMMEHFILQPDLEAATESADHYSSSPPRKNFRNLDLVREQLMKIEERRVDAETRLAHAVEQLASHPQSEAVMQALLATTEAQQETARAQADAAREQTESARQQAEVARLQAEIARAMLEEIQCRKEK